MQDQDKKRRERAQSIRAKTSSAYNQGYLDPLIEYLQSERKTAAKPKRPQDGAWANARAFDDGDVYRIDKILKWIEVNSKTAPDGAINTED